MIYQIQALGPCGDWDSKHVAFDAYATEFATMEEAREELVALIEIQDRNRSELRIVEMEGGD